MGNKKSTLKPKRKPPPRPDTIKQSTPPSQQVENPSSSPSVPTSKPPTTGPSTSSSKLQAKPRAASRFGGKRERCLSCGDVVYANEKLQLNETQIFHKTCFKCFRCKIELKLINYSALDGKVFCKKCFDYEVNIKKHVNK